MALPISLPGKHLTLPHSYPSIACALVHHSLQLRSFPDYDKLPDSHYLQCTTISNIYRIFSPELEWKKLPLKQIKLGNGETIAEFPLNFIVSQKFVKDFVDHLAQIEMCKEKQSAESGRQQMQQLEQDVQWHWMRAILYFWPCKYYRWKFMNLICTWCIRE